MYSALCSQAYKKSNIFLSLNFYKMTNQNLDLKEMGLIPLASVEEKQINGG